MTISTTYFREHLAEVIDLVVDQGEEIILVFGKGKNAKRTKLSSAMKKPKRNKNRILDFVESDDFKNHKVNIEFQKAKNFENLMENHYEIKDFVG